MDKRTDFEVQI